MVRFPAIVGLIFALAHPAGAAEPRMLGHAPKAPVRRVVTLAPSLTEIVLDLHGADRLAGVSRYDDAPEVKKLPRVGGFLDPAPEAVLALQPDLVLAEPSPGNHGAVDRLAQLGIPVLVTPLHTVAEILASVRAVGKALGDAPGGEALAHRIEGALAAVRARTSALPRKRVLVVYGWQPLVVAGPDSFADSVIDAAGGENVAHGLSGPYPVFSAEALLAAAPEVVVDATGLEHGPVSPPPGLSARVVKAPSQALLRPGPRLADAVREMATILHPEIPAEAASHP